MIYCNAFIPRPFLGNSYSGWNDYTNSFVDVRDMTVLPMANSRAGLKESYVGFSHWAKAGIKGRLTEHTLYKRNDRFYDAANYELL